MTPANSRVRVKGASSRKSPRAPSAAWRIRRSQRLQILEVLPFTKLEWLVHGFSTRPGGVSEFPDSANATRPREKVLNLGFTEWDTPENVESNRRRFLASLNSGRQTLRTLRQIHSDIIHVADASSGESPKGDAWIARAGGQLLAIQTADCIPILLVDTKLRAVAAVHAGWRGTLARIAAKSVGRMQLEFGSQPKDILAAIGPGIGPCCYEVGPDVVNEFAAQFSQAKDWFHGPFDALASGENPISLPWLTMMPPGHQPPPPRSFLDLYTANSAILVAAGVRRKNIFVSEACTSCRTDLFFSYRREGRTGRMMAAIGIS